MICFYHNSDHDGHCSGALVKLTFPDVRLVGVNYSLQNELQYLEENVGVGEKVVICDFSFSVEGMKYLLERCGNDEVIWIDHHISAINKIKEAGLHIQGIRDINKAGCELTWQYFWKTKPTHRMPDVVRLLGRYDVWDHNDADILPFHYGMNQYNTNPAYDMSLWIMLLSGTKNTIIKDLRKTIFDQILEEGKLIERYQDKQNEIKCKHAFYCSFKGQFERYRIIGLLNVSGSLSFKSIWDPEKFDIMMTANYDGINWVCSLYTDEKDVDVSEICVQHGGGGHKGAAGFSTPDLFALLEMKGRVRDLCKI